MSPSEQDSGFWSRILTSSREMEQPATLPLRFPSSPIDLRPSILEWNPYNPPPFDQSTVLGSSPTSSSASYELPIFSKTTTFKRPKRRKQPSLVDRREDNIPSSLPTLVAGSSALLGALAVSILTPGSFPTSTSSTKNLPRCPPNWGDATRVGLGCVWADTRGGGVSSSLIQLNIFFFCFLDHDSCTLQCTLPYLR